MLVYDITNRRSFENIPIWLDEAKRHCHRDIVVVIIGNKCDLNNNRVVRYFYNNYINILCYDS